jgi:hypothetical protein
MKAKKIKIEQEILDVPNSPYYEECIILPLTAKMLCEGELPTDTLTATIERYQVKQVYNGKEKENYLVKINDLDIFDDLLNIGITGINEIINKNTKHNLERLEEEFYIKTKKKIEQLENNPLWRRLLKKYK